MDTSEIEKDETELSAELTDVVIAKKLIQLKQSADSRKIKFDLSFKTVKKLLSVKKCYYTGKVFDTVNVRSVDRVNSNKGYINGNVVACTVLINQKKGNLTCEEIHSLSKKIKEHSK